MSFVQSYFADIEKTLLALSGVAGNAGHSVIKGSAREYFVAEFLSKHISPLWRVGSGEIIHRETKAPDKRNQIDAVVYSSQVPQFEYAPGCSTFLIEGVSAFIEVKTKLTKARLKTAIKTTQRIKAYPRNVTQKINPNGLVKNPRPYSFLVAFDGCGVRTLVRWLTEAHEELGLSFNELVTTPPRDPLSRIYDFDARLLNAKYSDLSGLSIRYRDDPIDGPHISEDGRAEVHYAVRRAMHHVPCPLPKIYFQFAADRDVASFTIHYKLVAANIRERREDRLHIKVERPEAVAAPPPPGNFQE